MGTFKNLIDVLHIHHKPNIMLNATAKWNRNLKPQYFYYVNYNFSITVYKA